MSILVLGKYTHTTRFRQIVETQSLNELTSEEHRILSKDQKHSSTVAKVHYQKQRSREVALKGYECLQKLQGAKSQRWTRMSTQDSEIQLPTPGLQLKECKISAKFMEHQIFIIIISFHSFTVKNIK